MGVSADLIAAQLTIGVQALGLFLALQLLLALLIAPTWLLSYRGLRSFNTRRRTALHLQRLQGLLAWGILAVYLPVQRQQAMSGLRLLLASSALLVAIIGGGAWPELQPALWIYTLGLGLLASRPGLFMRAVNRLTSDH